MVGQHLQNIANARSNVRIFGRLSSVLWKDDGYCSNDGYYDGYDSNDEYSSLYLMATIPMMGNGIMYGLWDVCWGLLGENNSQ